MKKRFLSMALILCMLAGLVTVMPVTAGAAASINIGEYVQMGTYYGEPILWRCVDIDENGPLMLSDKIICIKPFDAKGDNTAGSHGRGRDDGQYRKQWGSNYWADSNMRCWLNSDASAGNVNWTCGNAPTEDKVWSGYNEYADEAGFLTNFTIGEKKAIKPVTQKSLLDGYEHNSNNRDSNYHRYNSNINKVLQNYDTALSEQVTDSIFLLDVKQVNAVYKNSNILGDEYYVGEPTQQCVSNSEYVSSGLRSGNKWYYWLRSQSSGNNSSYCVRCVSSGGDVINYTACDDTLGVRPAFYLNLSSSSFTSGRGTAAAPYTVTGSGGTVMPAVTPAPTLGIDSSYAGGETIIQQYGLDVQHMLSNITVSSDTLRGPKISILGKDFYLFELDGTCTLKLGNINIQCKADEKKNTIQLLGGYNFISGSVSTGTSYAGRGEWTKAYNDLKSLYGAINSGSLDDTQARSKFSSVYNKMKSVNSNLFLNIKGNFAVFGELSCDNGTVKLTEGGVIVKASASGSIDPRIGGIFYGTFGLSVNASGKIGLKFDGIDKPMAVNSKITLEPAVNVGVGAGSKKAKFYIEGGLKGKLPIEIIALTGSFKDGASFTPLKVTAKGYIYMSAQATKLFTAEKEWQLGGDAVLYPRNGDLSLQSIEDCFTLDKSEFKMLPRDYGSVMSIMSVSEVFEKQAVFPYSTPQLAQLEDGRQLLLWIDDDPGKADADRTSLYYSIYTPSDNSWSAPQIAAENAGYNDTPQICTDGNKVYVAWTYIDESLGDTTDIDTIMTKLDLYYTCFDGSTFSTPRLISEKDNGRCETLYDISERDGVVTIAWAENSENDLTLENGTNSINTCHFKTSSGGGSVISVTSELHDLQLTGDGRVVYETGTDGKSEIYLDGTLIGESENDNSSFGISGDEVYYLSGTALNTYNIITGEKTSVETGEITDITILGSTEHKTALTLVPTGFTNELYRNDFENGSWGEWTQLTDFGRYIRDCSAVVNKDGTISAALNLVEVKDEEKGGYGQAELKVINDLEYSDVILDSSPFYDGIPTAGESIDVCFNVTNNSRNYIDSINAEITDADGGIMYSGALNCGIGAGETALLKASVTIPADFRKQDLTVSISGGFEENDMSNNTASLTVGFADLALEKTALKKNGDTVTLEGYVKNIGFENAENVMLNIYNSDASDELLQTIELSSEGAGEEKPFEFELPARYLSYTGEKQALYIEVVSDTAETEFGNNSDRIVLADLSELDTVNEVSMSYSDGILTVKSPNACGADFIAAYYNPDGSLMACRTVKLSIAAGTNAIPIEGLAVGSNVKLMLWDEDMKPLCGYQN